MAFSSSSEDTWDERPHSGVLWVPQQQPQQPQQPQQQQPLQRQPKEKRPRKPRKQPEPAAQPTRPPRRRGKKPQQSPPAPIAPPTATPTTAGIALVPSVAEAVRPDDGAKAPQPKQQRAPRGKDAPPKKRKPGKGKKGRSAAQLPPQLPPQLVVVDEAISPAKRALPIVDPATGSPIVAAGVRPKEADEETPVRKTLVASASVFHPVGSTVVADAAELPAKRAAAPLAIVHPATLEPVRVAPSKQDVHKDVDAPKAPRPKIVIVHPDTREPVPLAKPATAASPAASPSKKQLQFVNPATGTPVVVAATNNKADAPSEAAK